MCHSPATALRCPKLADHRVVVSQVRWPWTSPRLQTDRPTVARQYTSMDHLCRQLRFHGQVEGVADLTARGSYGRSWNFTDQRLDEMQARLLHQSA